MSAVADAAWAPPAAELRGPSLGTPATARLRIAVVHEWLHASRGSENTFLELAVLFPQADLYALTWNREGFTWGDTRAVHTTLLDRVRLFRERPAYGLPLMPVAWKRLRPTQDYDLVISSSHAFVRAFPTGRALHLSYTHTPLRVAWCPEIDRRGRRLRALSAPVEEALRRVDRHFAAGVHDFAANSSEVADRIRHCYGRSSRVIAPPCDTEFYTPSPTASRRHLLAVSRFVPYKRIDLAVRVAAQLGRPLVVAGSGPGELQLRALAARLAPGLVTFEVRPSNERLRELYRSALALIFPAHEDFGIVPVEAMACGTPVVCLDRGGTLDTVLTGTTGVHVGAQDTAAFAAGVQQVLEMGPDPGRIRAHATTFSRQAFRDRIASWVESQCGSVIASSTGSQPPSPPRSRRGHRPGHPPPL